MLKIAVPTLNGQLTTHFGHCEKFAIINVQDNKILGSEFITPPIHQPGVYPRFLADLGVKVIIAGGMGQKAQDLFAQNNIEVYMGVSADTPTELAEKYIGNNLDTGENQCTH